MEKSQDTEICHSRSICKNRIEGSYDNLAFIKYVILYEIEIEGRYVRVTRFEDYIRFPLSVNNKQFGIISSLTIY